MRTGLIAAAIAFASVAPTFAQSVDDLAIVDCRLPPKMKRVGGRTYPMAQPPRRTTAVDCRIRGGEYTAYDRSNLATSLKIWQAEAEKGNVDAQYYVGKIYEAQLDYASAATWYEKAAAKNHSASQFALGTLYEKGLGVSMDEKKAFSLYRSAAGLTGDYVFVESAKYDELVRASEELALREQEIEELQRQLDEAKKKQKREEARERELQQQLDAAQKRIDSQKASMARLQETIVVTPLAPKTLPAPKKGTLGRFFALVIGNSQYTNYPAVPAAENDAKSIAAVLRDSYGFDVTLMLNAKNADILSKLYQLSQNLAPNDNLVVFYAGHGKRDLRNRRGWWLPVDAIRDDTARTNWLPNQEVSDRLALIAAKHILVLADASYVGDITRGAPQLEAEKLTPAQWTKYVEATKQKKARLALASGTDGASPRFTQTLVEVLRKQQGVVPASRVHREVVNAITANARVTSAVPTFAPLQSASHEGVDFLFEHK